MVAAVRAFALRLGYASGVMAMLPPGLTAARQRRVIIAISAAAAAAYLIIGLGMDAGGLWRALGRLGYRGCTLILCLSAANYLLRFARWNMYQRSFGHRLPAGMHLLYYLGGFAFTLSPGKVGEALRSVYLRDHGVTYAQSIASFFAERLLDVFAIVVLAALIAADHAAYRPLVGGALALVVIALLLVGRPWLPGLVTGAVKWRSRRMRSLAASLADLLGSSARLLRPRLLILGTFAGIAAWGAEGLGFFCICEGLQLPVAVASAVGIYSLAVLAGSAAFLLPAGIGGMEIAMTTLLVQSGAPFKSALLATLLCRLATLWFAVFIGVLAVALVELRPRLECSRAPT
jgi:uncharacterized protein (TIRG00374 family)